MSRNPVPTAPFAAAVWVAFDNVPVPGRTRPDSVFASGLRIVF